MSATCDQWAQRWSADQQDIAQAVCSAESGGNPTAECHNCAGVPEWSIGVGQVNILAHPQFASWNLFDVASNAEASFQIWQAQGWSAWSTYTNGAYQKYLRGAPPTVAGTPASPGPAVKVGVLLLAAVAAWWLL